MTITCIEQWPVVEVDAFTCRAPTAQDSVEDIYIRARFSNGYECFIPSKWGDDVIANEIAIIIAEFDSETPPVNWTPYAGFGG